MILYGKTREEVYDKEMAALEQIDNATFRRKSPTVAEYCEKWLLMQSVHIRATTLIDYTSKVRRHIIKELGEKRMADVTLDDIQVALVPVSKKSASVYKSVVILYKSIFRAAKESHVIDTNPTIYLEAKGGGVPQEERQALTDEQVERLLDAIRGLPPYVFVMIGLYAGLRREEILALQWDSVYLDTDAPYLTVRRAWHTEHNRPVILTELKTKAAERNIPLPDRLAECLKEAKKKSTSDYVIANQDGEPLSYTQFKRLWQYIVTRTAKPRMARKLVDGKYVKYMLYPKLGEKARNNGHVVYSLDFDVTPHMLRHTYITNLIHASVDPKTVQYLAGHESSKITMDIYAKVFLDVPTPYISVRRAWRSENNRPVISTTLKTKAARRDIPIPKCLTDCLREVKEKTESEYVVADRNGNPLSSSQFQRVWKYVTVRSTKPHNYYKYVNGQCVKCTVTPTPGSHQKNNPKLVYAIDFDVTPHQLRHTYITNLLYAGIDPKTVQYLAGYENSKTTMDIYAQVKYNKPEELLSVVNAAFAPSVGV